MDNRGKTITNQILLFIFRLDIAVLLKRNVRSFIKICSKENSSYQYTSPHYLVSLISISQTGLLFIHVRYRH